jgi:hypothetical protein
MLRDEFERAGLINLFHGNLYQVYPIHRALGRAAVAGWDTYGLGPEYSANVVNVNKN